MESPTASAVSRPLAGLTESDLNTRPAVVSILATPPSLSMPDMAFQQKPQIHSAPSSPTTPSPFRSATNHSSHTATLADAESPLGSSSHHSGFPSSSPSRRERQREHSAPIRSLFKQTSRKLLGKKPSIGQWRREDGARQREGKEGGSSGRSSVSSMRDLLELVGVKRRSQSQERASGGGSSGKHHVDMREEVKARGTGQEVMMGRDGQFDDAASLASPVSKLHIGHHIPSGPLVTSKAHSLSISASQQRPSPDVPPLLTSSRPISTRTTAHARFTFPLHDNPFDSPFHETSLDDNTTVPAAAVIEAQRRNLAIARLAGFIPASLMSLRNEPFARAAREYDHSASALVLVTGGEPALRAHDQEGLDEDEETSSDETPIAHQDPCRQAAPRQSRGLMQRISLAMEYEAKERHLDPQSSSVTSRPGSLGRVVGKCVVSRSSDVSVSETTRDDVQLPSGIFSPKIPQEPISRGIEGTLSKRHGTHRSANRAQSPRSPSRPRALNSLFDGPPAPTDSMSNHRSQQGAERQNSNRDDLPPADELRTLPSKPATSLRRATSARVSGAKADSAEAGDGNAQPPKGLTYKLSRTSFPRAHFNMTPMPTPVPPSLLERAKSDGGRLRKREGVRESVDPIRRAVSISRSCGEMETHSAPASTFTVPHARASLDGARPAPAQTILSPETEAMIQAQVRARTRVSITPGTEGFVLSGSTSSSAGVSRKSSRSSRSGGHEDQ